MNENKVTLLGWYGGDKVIARTAWTSTQADVDKKTDEQIRDLLVNKLWNNKSGKSHKTPFERGIVEFNVLCEQASHIHTIKHRLAQINGESARYMELKEDKFYLPKDWKGIFPQEPNILCEYLKGDWNEILKGYSQLGNSLYHQALKELSPILGRKRAKESSRFFKTINSQLNLSIMMNMSCFYNFYTLRADDAAQDEIHEIAEQMLQCIKDIEGNPFKFTLEAWNF